LTQRPCFSNFVHNIIRFFLSFMSLIIQIKLFWPSWFHKIIWYLNDLMSFSFSILSLKSIISLHENIKSCRAVLWKIFNYKINIDLMIGFVWLRNIKCVYNDLFFITLAVKINFYIKATPFFQNLLRHLLAFCCKELWVNWLFIISTIHPKNIPLSNYHIFQ
jgi:hypothetical protein